MSYMFSGSGIWRRLGFLIIAMLIAWLPGHAAELNVWPIGWNLEMIKYVEENVVPRFQEKHPGVNVVFTSMGWGNEEEKLILAIAAGIPPDIVTTGGTTIVSYVPRGLLAPLDRYLARWENYRYVYPGAWENARWGGQTYSVPLTVDLRLIAYHQDIFAETGLDPARPPGSWEELEQAAGRTTRTDANAVSRRGIVISTGVTGAAQRFGHFLMQANGKIISDDGRRPLYNNEVGLGTLEFLKRLYDIGHPKGMNAPPGTGMSAFAAQQIAIDPAASYSVSLNLLRDNPDVINQLGAFAPRRSQLHNPIALAFINGHGIPSASKRSDMAWDFMEGLLTHDNAKAFVEINGFMMPRMDLAKWIMANRPALAKWFMAMDHVRAWPQVPAAIQGYNSLGSWIAPALLGELAPRTALEQAEREQQILFDDFWRRLGQ
jgi:multiple sugar transport system substrate-binding protein